MVLSFFLDLLWGESADNALEHSIVGELEKPRKPTDFMSGIGEQAGHQA
jgi:hypothetical protein